MRGQQLDRLLVPVHHVQDSRGQPRLGKQLGEPQRAGGILLGGFQDEGVAAGDGDGKHPHRHHRGEVERGDPHAHAERLPEGMAVDAGPDVFREAPLQQVGDPAGELHHLHSPGQGAARVAQHLAVLGRDQGRTVPPRSGPAAP